LETFFARLQVHSLVCVALRDTQAGGYLAKFVCTGGFLGVLMTCGVHQSTLHTVTDPRQRQLSLNRLHREPPLELYSSACKYAEPDGNVDIAQLRWSSGIILA